MSTPPPGLDPHGPGGDPGADPGDGSGRDPGSVTPTGPGPLVVLGALAAVVGWSVRPVSLRLGVAEPVLTVWSLLVVGGIAVGVGVVAFRTWRILQRPRPGRVLEPFQAVNRLVLGKAAALAGAVLLGGYAGFAIAHLGIPTTDLSGQRLLRGAIAAGLGLLLMIAGLLLERACRVRSKRE